MLSDHALSTSGVGCQSRFLINGLIEKGCWSFRQFGAAIKHTDYDTVKVNDDFVIKPVDGFGDRELIIQTLATEKPDILFLFTDPRFFIWLWEMEDEVHNMCPIAYWHVWDNFPVPEFNRPLYDATDLINCHSYLTYQICQDLAPERSNFIPHSLPPDIFFPISKSEIKDWRDKILGPERRDHFILFWVNRNARRKRPADVLLAWSMFIEKVRDKHGKSDATLLMHTDPLDPEGPNLLSVSEKLNIKDSVVFSTDRIDFDKMNILHNISDACINIAYAEGFGLATLESMQCGKPVIAVKTGGLTRQVVDHRDGTENGFALDVVHQTLVGSQQVPYIYEDYADIDEIVDAMMKMYEAGPEGREKLGKKARDYVMSEFNHQTTIDLWHDSLLGLIEDWKNNKRKRWSIEEVTP